MLPVFLFVRGIADPRARSKTEIYNLFTGVCLLIAGGIDLFRADYSMALSWAIFGSMYLVMDDYTYNEGAQKTLLEKITHISRHVFSVTGALLSVVLIAYYIATY